MTKRNLLLQILALVVLIVLLVYPFDTTVVPQWRIQVVDEAGKPIPGTLVSQDWKDHFAEREAHIDEQFSDSEGFVTFARRGVRAHLAMRIVRSLGSMINPHGGSGRSSFLAVTRPGSGHAEYSPGKPLPEKLVVRRNEQAELIGLSQERLDANMSAWQLLLTVENQDLGKLDEHFRLRLKKAIGTLVGKRDNEFLIELLIPRLLSKISNSQGQVSYVLIEESPLSFIPGESGIRVHIFSPEGGLLLSSGFSSGWRIALTKMRVTFIPQIGREVLEVGSRPYINGRDVTKQYYALVGEKLLLVRLEDSSGRPIRNLYGAPNHAIGLTLVGRSASEWEKALESNDVAEVLATLTWLGGIHWNPRNPPPNYVHEDMSESQLADDVRSLEGVKVRLHRLQQSENAWVRRAAEFAVNAEYY